MERHPVLAPIYDEKIALLEGEIDRLRAELAEYNKLKGYAKSLNQETYLELHARNEQMRTALVEISKSSDASTCPCVQIAIAALEK